MSICIPPFSETATPVMCSRL